jgi:hypothetical protein
MLLGGKLPTLSASTCSHCGRRIWNLRRRIEQLEAKLEAIGEVKDCGVWLPDLEYQKGNYTTHSGSLWCAQGRTRSRPGSDSSWRLQFKQGAFSK